MGDQQRAREFCPREFGINASAFGGVRLRGYTETQMLEAITAALRAGPECPEGFVMVPVKPTDEMVEAAEMAETRHVIENRKRRGNDPELSYQGIYRAMLAARPQGVKDV